MLDQQLDSFLQYLAGVKGASSHTVRNYSLDIVSYLNFSDGKLDKASLRAYLASLHTRNCSKRTRARHLSALRSFCQFLLQIGVLQSDPTREIERPKLDRPIPKFLSYDQIRDFLAVPDLTCYLGLRDRTIMEILYATGIRISELCALDRGDFQKSQALLKVKGKGKSERIVPMTNLAMKWLQDYLTNPSRYLDSKRHKKEQDPNAIFLNRFGKRITPRSVERSFKIYQTQLGIANKITPHTLRHTIATHLLENGMDLKSIQEILGHKSLSATTIYTSVSTRLKQETYQKHHPLSAKDPT